LYKLLVVFNLDGTLRLFPSDLDNHLSEESSF